MKQKLDLTIAFWWAILMLIAVLVTDNYVVRLLLSTPLVFFLTGHVLLRAIRPYRTGLLEHAVYSVGVSIATCVFGGFVLNKLSLLYPIGWAIWLVLVNGAAAYFALRQPYEPFVLPKFPRMRPWQITVAAAAVIITICSYVLADYEIESFHQFKYTEFWLIPKGSPGKLVVGIRNQEAQPQEFDLEVRAGKNLIASLQSIKVKPGEEWLHEITTSLEASKAEATLYETKDHAVYRRASAFIPGTKPDANITANTVLPTNNRR